MTDDETTTSYIETYEQVAEKQETLRQRARIRAEYEVGVELFGEEVMRGWSEARFMEPKKRDEDRQLRKEADANHREYLERIVAIEERQAKALELIAERLLELRA